MSVDNDELLKLLENSKEITRSIKIDNTLKFMSFYNLVPGNDKIKFSFLYSLFKNYIKSPKTEAALQRELSIHLQSQDSMYFISLENSRIKDLLETFEMPSKDFHDSYYTLVTNFIDSNELRLGDDIKIGSSALYELMKLRNKKCPITFEVFDEIMAELITPVVDKNGHTYKLNASLKMHFTDTEIEDAKNGKEKTDPKIKRKVPKPKARVKS